MTLDVKETATLESFCQLNFKKRHQNVFPKIFFSALSSSYHFLCSLHCGRKVPINSTLKYWLYCLKSVFTMELGCGCRDLGLCSVLFPSEWRIWDEIFIENGHNINYPGNSLSFLVLTVTPMLLYCIRSSGLNIHSVKM